ncbi:HD domain-containing protein [Chloroflexota bacterium]
MEESMPAYSERYDAALVLAAKAHRGQTRKASDIPYIVHPMHVSVTLLRCGFSEDKAIAGLLHDVVEDQDVPLAVIEERFGPDVAYMVDVVTERKREGEVVSPWEIRKQETLDRLRTARPGSVALKAADVLCNARSLASQLRNDGPSVWGHYNRGPAESLWYYGAVAAVARERLGAHPLVDELDAALHDLEQAMAACQAS